MSKRKVVIGLPVFNGQEYLRQAIESHLSQTFGDFDLVISDNGSTDATPGICADYASKDERIKYLRTSENRGVLWNHRRVFEAVETSNKYFRWAGADDVVEPGLLQSMVDVLETRPEVEAVVPEIKNIDEHGRIIDSTARTLDLQTEDVAERAYGVLVGRYQLLVPDGLMRVSTLRSMRTLPNYLAWDRVFVWELALRGQIVQQEGPALLRRFHSGATSRVKTAKEMKKWVEPTFVPGMRFPHWKWAYERARVLIGCPLPIRDRMRVGSLLARATLWQRRELMRDITQAVRRALRLSDEYTF